MSNHLHPSSSVSKIVLKNGVTVLLDSIPYACSASCALCFRGGSRDESASTAGVTHLGEHLIFKRTTAKSPLEIAHWIDDLGGEINAFTDAESMCLVGRVSSRRVEDLFSLFGELVRQVAFTDEDLVIEKDIIHQEIVESLDDPNDTAYREFSRLFWEDVSMGRPVFGSLETVQKLTSTEVRSRLKELLLGSRIVVAVAGNLQMESLVSIVERLFADLEPGQLPSYQPSTTGRGTVFTARPVNQAHLTLGLPWPHFAHPDYLAGVIVSSILGGGVSSRLFQSLRERTGLAYDVQSAVDSFGDGGALEIHATVDGSNVGKALQLITEELQSLAAKGVLEDEFSRAINSSVAQLEMDADSIASRMWRLVETELYLGKYVSATEWVDRLRALTRVECQRMANSLTGTRGGVLSISGKIDTIEIPEELKIYFCQTN